LYSCVGCAILDQRNSQIEHPSFLPLQPSQVTHELCTLFSPTDPAYLRCQAVLDGHAAGRIFTDHPETPSWAVLQEAAFGSLYLADGMQSEVLSKLIHYLHQQGDVLVGLWQDDPRWGLLPAQAQYCGYTLEFTDHQADENLPGIPPGCELKRLDHSLSKQILGRNFLARLYGSIQLALEWGYGLCLVRGDELLCEAFAGPAAGGVIEIGVETAPHHMRKGYATLTCAHLIAEMEGWGYSTYWNCDKGNLASAALARRLGYRLEKEYKLVAWFKQDGPGENQS
jgi:GNAT superfamily N-acetyltransferase